MTTTPDGGADRLSPDEAFALLGNETRVGILRALWSAFESGTRDNAVPYSELFARVEIRDSGNFAYHLEKLTGPFVRRTADGYALKQTGINIVRAVIAGTVTDDPELEPTIIDVACPLCRARIEVSYTDELITVRCPDCEGIRRWNDETGFIFFGIVPPPVLDRPTPMAVFRTGVSYVLHQIAMFHDGICPHCSSSVNASVTVCDEHDTETGGSTLCPQCERVHMAEVWMECSMCKRSMFPPVAGVVLDDPRVTAFYRDHGIDHRFHTWAAMDRSFDVREELRSEDPLRLSVTIPAGDDELRLTVDEHLDVIDVVA